MNTTQHIPLSSSNLLAWQLMRLRDERKEEEPHKRTPEMPKPKPQPEIVPPPAKPEVKPEIRPEIIPPSQQPEVPLPPHPLPGSNLRFYSYR